VLRQLAVCFALDLVPAVRVAVGPLLRLFQFKAPGTMGPTHRSPRKIVGAQAGP
jgi:hypothetical protein